MRRVNYKSALQQTSTILSSVNFMALPTLRLTANVVNPKPLLPKISALINPSRSFHRPP
jgi:hypothetical protein